MSQKKLIVGALVALVLVIGVQLFVSHHRQHVDTSAASTPSLTTTVTTTTTKKSPTTIAPKPPVAPPAPVAKHPTLAAQDYVVKPGDTLWSISGQFSHIPGWFPAIANASWVKDPNLIFPGQVLHIPEIP